MGQVTEDFRDRPFLCLGRQGLRFLSSAPAKLVVVDRNMGYNRCRAKKGDV